MKKTIAFILPYFGKFHNYFQLFLDSCAYNPDITWFLFTDQNEKYRYPENVTVVPMQFAQLRERIQSCYDFPIVLDNPYDLCDFKVAYGEIFSDYLKGYDFWGFCDCDLIFGNLRSFLTEELLDAYDKIFMRGHCTLFRNTENLCRLYRNPIDGVEQYRVVFTEGGAHHFDEGYPDRVKGINRIYTDAGKRIYDAFLFADIEVERWAFRQADYRQIPQETEKSENSVFAWEEGRLYRYYLSDNRIEKEEFMYIHLQKRKMKNDIPSDKKAEKYLIYPNRFQKWENIDIININKFNRNRIYLERELLRIGNGLKRRLRM